MWTTQSLEAQGGAVRDRAKIAELNPLFHYLDIVRAPMIGQPQELYHWDIAMTEHVNISTHNACVDFPIFDAKSRSMKKAFLGKAGGAIGRNSSDVVVVEALKDITMTLKEGDRVGLVGHNGAGKSTLLRLLSGIYEPTRGSATIRGRVAPVFDLGVGMDPEISGYENIIIRGLFLGQTRKQMLAKMDEIADFTELGDYLDMPLRTYSTGMRVRIAMGVVTSIDPEILLLDEGIGAVDAEFMKKARLCNSAMWIDHGQIRMQGDIEDVVRAYEGDDAAEHVRHVIKEMERENTLTQSRSLDHLVVVDNADEADVKDLVDNAHCRRVTSVLSTTSAVPEDLLGAFYALSLGADRVWLADDDGRPEGPETASRSPCAAARRSAGCVPNSATDLLPGIASLFNGALFTADAIDAVGVPDLRLFVRGDEVEVHRRLVRSGLKFGTCLQYCLRPPQRRGRVQADLSADVCTRSTPTTTRSATSPYRNRGYILAQPGMRKLLPQEWVRFGWYFLITRRDPGRTTRVDADRANSAGRETAAIHAVPTDQHGRLGDRRRGTSNSREPEMHIGHSRYSPESSSIVRSSASGKSEGQILVGRNVDTVVIATASDGDVDLGDTRATTRTRLGKRRNTRRRTQHQNRMQLNISPTL
ncbi:unnamed protein product, partial [Mesorhabditis spiculigera]